MDPRVSLKKAEDVLDDAQHLKVQIAEFKQVIDKHDQELQARINAMSESDKAARALKARQAVAGLPEYTVFRHPKQKPIGYSAYKRTEVKKYLEGLLSSFEGYQGGSFGDVFFNEYVKLLPSVLEASFALMDKIIDEVIAESERDIRYYGEKVKTYMKNWEASREEKQEKWYEEKRKPFLPKEQESAMTGKMEKKAAGDYFNEYLLPDFEALDKELGSGQWVQRQQELEQMKMQNTNQDPQGENPDQASPEEVVEQQEGAATYRPTYDRRRPETKEERLQRVKEEYGRRPFISVGCRELKKRRQRRLEQIKQEYPGMDTFDPAKESVNPDGSGFTQLIASNLRGFCK